MADLAPNPLSVADISGPARLLRLVRYANHWMLLVGALGLFSHVVWVAAGGHTLWEHIASGLAVLVYGWCAWVGWKNIGVLESAVHRDTQAGFIVFGTCSAILASVFFPAFRTAWHSGFVDGRSAEAGVAFVIASLGVLVTVPAAVALAALGRRALPLVHMSLRTLLGASLSSSLRTPMGARLPPAHARRGVLCVVVGGLWMIGLQCLVQFTDTVLDFVPEVLWPILASPQTGQIGALGVLFFVWARHYFRPDFTTVMAGDQRPPVVFLRSFADDERPYDRPVRAMLDFSLEARLAEHFTTVGPFIAVGAPKDGLPHLGAARARLGDDEWQDVVSAWMAGSAVIILMAGTSHWIRWELERVVDLEQVTKLVVLIPEARSVWARRRKSAERLEVVRRAFAGTAWEPGLAALDRPWRIRSLTFLSAGVVVTVTSTPRNRESYQLAVLMAHDLQRDFRAVADAPEARLATGGTGRLAVWLFVAAVVAVVAAVAIRWIDRQELRPLPAAAVVTSTGRLTAGNVMFGEGREGIPQPPRYRAGDRVRLSFEVEGYAVDARKAAAVHSTIVLMDAAGDPAMEPLTVVFREPIARGGRIRFTIELDLPDSARRGEYWLYVDVEDLVATAEFEFMNRLVVDGPDP